MIFLRGAPSRDWPDVEQKLRGKLVKPGTCIEGNFQRDVR